MPAPIRAAIFGNRFARDVILPVLRQIPGVTVVGLCSPNQAKARETAREFGIPAVFSDHETLLNELAPDLVFIATPPSLHAPMAIAALKAGAHVVCEKPMALDHAECRQMLEMAERTGRIALIDHELRFLPGMRKMRELLHDGAIGRPFRASCTMLTDTRRDPRNAWSWWSDINQGGGAWNTMGVHVIDSLCWLIGPPQGIPHGRVATANASLPDPVSGAPRIVTADDYAVATLPLLPPAGFDPDSAPVEASILISMAEPFRKHEVTISGDAGMLRLAAEGPLEIHRNGRWDQVEVRDDLPPLAPLGIPDMYWARGFFHFARQLIPALAAGQAPKDAADFADGLRNQEILEQAVMQGRRSG